MTSRLRQVLLLLFILIPLVFTSYGIRTYSHCDSLELVLTLRRTVSVIAGHHSLIFQLTLHSDDRGTSRRWFVDSWAIQANQTEGYLYLLDHGYGRVHFAGFWYCREYDASREPSGKTQWIQTQWMLAFPAYSMSIASCIPLLLLIRRRHRSPVHPAENLCPTCGYDLRASKDRCSECGTAIPSSPPVPIDD